MKYRIVSVGKIREVFYLQGVNEYLKRLGPYVGIEFLDGLEEKISPRAGSKDIERCLRKEGERILSLIGGSEIIIVLDIYGKMYSSEDFARQMQTWNQSGVSRINLVIGGSHGLDPEVKRRADQVISFSNMTLPHQMAVLILAEQIYRGFKIIKGEPYHK